MNIKFPLNDLLNIVSKAENSGKIKEAISLIETQIGKLEPAEQSIAQSVKAYLQTKLPQTAAEASARAQVEMSLLLNKIQNLFSRVNKDTILSEVTRQPVQREEWSMLKDNLDNNIEAMLLPRARDFWIENFLNRNLDGLNGKDMDIRFMQGAQRLVDLGVIDKSTFVIAHTGHNIPIAYQLMKNTQLGQVNGVLEFSRDSFPLMSDEVKKVLELFAAGRGKMTGLSKEERLFVNGKIKPLSYKILHDSIGNQRLLDGYQRQILENSSRISDQNFSYPGTLAQTTRGRGAKYLGLDFHRLAAVDISKLPTARELKEAGLNKVVFLDELHPVSMFDKPELDMIYEPMTRQKADMICVLYDTFLSNMYQGKVKEGLSAIYALDRFVAPKDITQKIVKPDSAAIKSAAQKIQNSTFGHTVNHITRDDAANYIRQLQNDMPVIIEGVDLSRIENFHFSDLTSSIDRITAQERASFKETDVLSGLVRYVDTVLKNKSKIV